MNQISRLVPLTKSGIVLKNTGTRELRRIQVSISAILKNTKLNSDLLLTCGSDKPGHNKCEIYRINNWSPDWISIAPYPFVSGS